MQPHDDPSISDEDGLLRFIAPVHWIFNANSGRYEISSAAFTESVQPPHGMSVDHEPSKLAEGLRPEAGRKTLHHGVARLVAGDMRRLGLKVGFDPLPGRAYHAEVWGLAGQKRLQRAIRDIAQVLIAPVVP